MPPLANPSTPTRLITFKTLLLLLLLLPSAYPRGEEPPFQGKVIYPQYYAFKIYPIYYQLSEEKKYIKNIFQSILSDNLAIQQVVYIEEAQPVKIYYPLETTAQGEDPRSAYLQNQPPPPKLFPLRYLREPNSPLQTYETLSGSGAKESLGEILNPNEFHLFQSIRAKNKTDYIIETTLFYGSTLLLHRRIVAQEDAFSDAAAKVSSQIRDVISGPKTGAITVFSNVERSSVYLNDTFLGKTPLSFSHLIPGSYTLRVVKDGHKDWEAEVAIVENKTRRYSAEMEEVSGELSMRIISNPEKSDVFININYAGQTPLLLDNLPPGQYRVRLVREGYIDQYLTINLQEGGSEKTYYFNLKKGDPKEVYTPNREVIGGITYRQLFKGSSFVTGALALSGLYLTTLSRNAENEALARESYSGGSPSPSEADKIDALYAEADAKGNAANYLYAGAALTGGVSLYFFYKYVESRDLKIASTSPQEAGQTIKVFSISTQISPSGFDIRFNRSF